MLPRRCRCAGLAGQGGAGGGYDPAQALIVQWWQDDQGGWQDPVKPEPWPDEPPWIPPQPEPEDPPWVPIPEIPVPEVPVPETPPWIPPAEPPTLPVLPDPLPQADPRSLRCGFARAPFARVVLGHPANRATLQALLRANAVDCSADDRPATLLTSRRWR